jgi:hypothetical protein
VVAAVGWDGAPGWWRVVSVSAIPLCLLSGALATPDIVWRAGLDLNPLNASDPDTGAWLTTLIWPEHDDRRDRLVAALNVAANVSIRIDRGDLRDGLAALLADVPAGVTPVIQHSATLAYLSAEDRRRLPR